MEVEKNLENKNLLISEVENAFNQLHKAFSSLELKEDRTVLDNQIKYYRGLNKDLYTEQSYRKMQDILLDIESSVNDNSSKEEIKEALSQLDKINSILVKQADYNLVLNKINELKKCDFSMYTNSSVKKLLKILDNASLYLENDNITTQGLYNQYDLIMNAYGQLQFKGDKEALKLLIDKFEKADLSVYTPESIKMFKEKLQEIKLQLSEELTDKECYQLMQELQNAYNSLEKKENLTIVPTSDVTMLYGYVVLGLVSIVGILYLKRRKEKQ